MSEIKEYRIRVTIDYPIWDYTLESALKAATIIAKSSCTAHKILRVECIKVGKPDNKELME